MPRPPRADVAGEIYHVLNRGNARMRIFHKDGDYEAFERVLAEGLEKYPVDFIAYQWMPNHWHMVLSPRVDGAMSRLMYWVTMTHTGRNQTGREIKREKSNGSGLFDGEIKRVKKSNGSEEIKRVRPLWKKSNGSGLFDE